MNNKCHSEKTKNKIRQSLIGKRFSDIRKINISEGLKNKWLDLDFKRRMSNVRKGRCPWNKDKTHVNDSRILSGILHPKFGKPVSIETKEKIRTFNIGKHLSDETKKKIGKASQGRRLTKEQLKKCLRRRTPTSLERKFQGIVNKFNLPYIFVGDGSFIIAGYNPDFINTNGEKIAIEVFAKYFKQLDGRNIETWKRKRTRIFKKYGWSIIFFNENQVTEKNISKYFA